MIDLSEKPLRVAAYCRVSTDKRDQANSLESQKKYFFQYITLNPLWEFRGIYADDGVSGTDALRRGEFIRMIGDAEMGKFDLIITKEISRFARNIVDCITYTRKLRELGVGVLFLSDSIYTMDGDWELRMALMSAMAQEESRKTSQRVKWGQRRQMEKGVVFGRGMLGYCLRDGKLTVNPEEAGTVRLIFSKFLDEGKGARRIARELNEEGIKPSEYMKGWTYTNILRILRNEKYSGDLIQGKTYTPDYLTHRKKRNPGEAEKVIIRDHHEPIISPERFEQIQRELMRRGAEKRKSENAAGRYALTGKIVCGSKGEIFYRRQRKRKDGSLSVSWVCALKRNGGKAPCSGCHCFSPKDEDIKEILKEALKDAVSGRAGLIVKALREAEKAAEGTKNEGLRSLREREKRLMDKRKRVRELLLEGYVGKEECGEVLKETEEELIKVREELGLSKVKERDGQDAESGGESLKGFIYSLSRGEKWDEVFYGQMADKIVLEEKGRVKVSLKGAPEQWEALILSGEREIEKYEKGL